MTPEEIASAIVSSATNDDEVTSIIVALKCALSGHDPIDELY
jgi:hypothetical protein